MARKKNNQGMDSLIRRIQKQVAAAPRKTLTAAEQIASDMARMRQQAMPRRFDNAIWLQLTAPVATNPAVGLYISPDGLRFLDLDAEGQPRPLDLTGVVRLFGDGSRGEQKFLRIWERASSNPPVAGLRGQDLLSAYRGYVKHPALAAPTGAALPPRAADKKAPARKRAVPHPKAGKRRPDRGEGR
jgi:hypothetical protein